MSAATLADHSGIEWASETFDRMQSSGGSAFPAGELDRTRRNLEGTAADYVGESIPADDDTGEEMELPETDVQPFLATEGRTVGTCAVQVEEGNVAIFKKPTALAANEWDEWEQQLEAKSERELTDAAARTLEEWAVSDDRTAEYWLSNFGRLDLLIISRQVQRGGNPQLRQ